LLVVVVVVVVATHNRYEVDRTLGVGEWINPVIAASTTGMLFKCTSNYRTMLLAGALGGAGAGLWQAAAAAVSDGGRR
jgi:hypothetical protein